MSKKVVSIRADQPAPSEVSVEKVLDTAANAGLKDCLVIGIRHGGDRIVISTSNSKKDLLIWSQEFSHDLLAGHFDGG